MQPIYEPRPRRVSAGFRADATCYVVADAMTHAECARVIREAVAQGFSRTGVDYPASYRDNDRLVRDDAALASWLGDRLRGVLPEQIVDGGETWELVGLNERFRLCRYTDGQAFRIHRDGAYTRGPDRRSLLTLQIYLDDATGFTGGRTRFYASRRGAMLGAVEPRRGSAVVFDHALWHDGEAVTAGTKHVLRTDVMYVRRESEAMGENGPRDTDLGEHGGYVFSVIALGGGGIASGSRDRTIRLWTREGDGARCVRVLRGHGGSVTALVETTPGCLWSGSRDHTIRAWDVATGASRVVATLGGAVLCLERSAGLVAAGTGEGAIELLHPGGGRPRTLRGHTGWVWSLASFSTHARGDERAWMASASEDGTVRVWSAAHGECVASAGARRGPVHAVASLGGGRLVAGFADGSLIVYAFDEARGSMDPVRIWDAHSGEVYALCPLGAAAGPSCTIATAGEDDLARIIDLETGAAVSTLRHDDFVRTLAHLGGGAIATGSYDGRVRVWAVHELHAPLDPRPAWRADDSEIDRCIDRHAPAELARGTAHVPGGAA